MVHLDISETSQVLSVVGGYSCIVGLISFFLKEKMFMSEPLVALLIGIAFGPVGADLINPLRWVGGNEHELQNVNFQISRIIIAIQVLFTGISLPKAYVWRKRLSLFTLLIPVMTCAWFASSLLVWAFIPKLTFLEALVIGSCVTPTDPVLSNSIAKGRFAEKYVPLEVRNIILGEAGANDGLGFPFLFLALYIMYWRTPSNPINSLGLAIGEWFYNVILYQILLSVLIGAVVGYIARIGLKYAERKSLIDRESLLAFGVALTMFTVGWVGIIGSDDILACFVVGNSLTWDDWFRLRSEEDSFQEVIDNLLNSAIFLYIGAVMPWREFGNFWDLQPWRLLVLGITIMLLRRLPFVMALKKFIPAVSSWSDTLFLGYFGPIGVGAMFYIEVAHHSIPDDGTRDRLRAVVSPVVYFMILTSVIVHGITIPIGKSMQRTLTYTRSTKAGGNIISRLPAPVPFGGSLPTHDTNHAEPKEVSFSVNVVRQEGSAEGEGGQGGARSFSPAQTFSSSSLSRTDTGSPGLHGDADTAGVSSGRTTPAVDSRPPSRPHSVQPAAHVMVQ